ncbi:MAG: hypothetical protein L6R38_001867 [Xanthoria sp. 2 TBL-2021]|nr:MAG: hypothetical protein L6R38_001867 [Xanthoria sp. 2 TBL-2021]
MSQAHIHPYLPEEDLFRYRSRLMCLVIYVCYMEGDPYKQIAEAFRINPRNDFEALLTPEMVKEEEDLITRSSPTEDKDRWVVYQYWTETNRQHPQGAARIGNHKEWFYAAHAKKPHDLENQGSAGG